MRTTRALLSLLCASGAHAQALQEVSIRFAQDLVLHGDLYRTVSPADAPAVLLFHQGGGDARGEYRDIIPELTARGFHVLSADVRGGGTRFGGTSRAAVTDSTFRYCHAIADVSAAIDLARTNGISGPLILWGSSYTATLAVQAAARRSGDVAAVLAFSPATGDPLRECEAEVYLPWLQRAGLPVLIVRAAAETTPERMQQNERFRRAGAQVFVAREGTHGSSTLVSSRVQGSVAPQRELVWQFLDAVRGPRAAGDGEAVVLESDGWQLHGTFQRAAVDGAAPAVLLLHKAAGTRTVFRELAAELARRGIASLSLDLRGHGESTTRGRFIPGAPASAALDDTYRDVQRALAYLRARSGVDSSRLAIVAASYSAEAAAQALRAEAGASAVGAHGQAVDAQVTVQAPGAPATAPDAATRVRVFVALSPGSFSDSSFAALPRTPRWLFVRSDDEGFVKSWLDDRVRAASRTAELRVVPAGSAHASDLLLAHAPLARELAAWLEQALSPGAPMIDAALHYVALQERVMQADADSADVDRMLSVVTDDFVYLHPVVNARVEGRTAVRAGIASHLGETRDAVIDVSHAHAQGSTVTLQTRTRFTTSNGQKVDRTGTMVLLFRDGRISWRVDF